jgi:hypothetical protein
MPMPVGQRRILSRMEKAIRASDPRLASILGMFGRLNHGEEMPAAEQLLARGRFALRSLPRKLAPGRDRRARSLTRYVVPLFSLLAVVAVVSTLIISGGSAHPARCPRSATADGSGHGTYPRACGLTVGNQSADLVLSRP